MIALKPHTTHVIQNKKYEIARRPRTLMALPHGRHTQFYPHSVAPSLAYKRKRLALDEGTPEWTNERTADEKEPGRTDEQEED
jgi:hypothetical protein